MKQTNSAIAIIYFVVALLIIATLTSGGCSQAKADFDILCEPLKAISSDSVSWHYAIYLDVNACLTCCEDLKSWQMLEQKIPECGGLFSIWAPIEDSIDVAEVMRLEGITTTVHILDSSIVQALKLNELTPPIKILMTSDCQVELIQGPLKAQEAREFDNKILKLICDGE